MGLFPDAMALSKVVDDVIFVTRYGKVARRAAKGLLSNLEESGSNVGVVLNDLPKKNHTTITLGITDTDTVITDINITTSIMEIPNRRLVSL